MRLSRALEASLSLAVAEARRRRHEFLTLEHVLLALLQDDAVAEVVGREGLADLGDGGVEVGPVVDHEGGRDEDAAIEVGEQQLGAHFGAVEADDTEVFGTDLLDAGVEHAARLAGGASRSASGATSGTGSSHKMSLQK